MAWFVPILIGAAIGGTTGGIVAHNNDVEWWKGAIAGSFIGAGIGAYMAPAFGAAGAYTTAGTNIKIATDGWGIATSIINGANINMAMGALGGADGSDLWKYGLVGAASGYFTASGGLGLAKKGFMGRLGFQGLGTAGRSIGNNWAGNEDPFSKVTLGVGPVNLTLGKGQRLVQAGNNWGNIVTNGLGFANLFTGGKFDYNLKHLTTKWSGGLMEKIMKNSQGLGLHSVLGEYMKNSSPALGHELYHIWQSRSIGQTAIIHYLAQGLNAITFNQPYYYKMNYFEPVAYNHAWGF